MARLKFTKEYLIENLQNLYVTLGRVPTIDDLKSPNPTVSNYYRFYKSFKDALIDAGLINPIIKDTKPETLLCHLQDEAKRLNKIPTRKEIANVNSKVYIEVFGSWINALENAGLLQHNDFCDTTIIEKCIVCNGKATGIVFNRERILGGVCPLCNRNNFIPYHLKSHGIFSKYDILTLPKNSNVNTSYIDADLNDTILTLSKLMSKIDKSIHNNIQISQIVINEFKENINLYNRYLRIRNIEDSQSK
jgi:hypothetical protein